LEQLMEIVNMVSKVLWDYILIFGLMGIGILMTIRLKFPQFSRVLPALKKNDYRNN
jgi:Na+/alanine symporter